MSPLKFNIRHIATHSARFMYSLQHGVRGSLCLKPLSLQATGRRRKECLHVKVTVILFVQCSSMHASIHKLHLYVADHWNDHTDL